MTFTYPTLFCNKSHTHKKVALHADITYFICKIVNYILKSANSAYHHVFCSSFISRIAKYYLNLAWGKGINPS